MTGAKLTVSGLSYRYGKREALSNVNLTFEPNRVYGLLGRNGAGKTTLLSIVSSSLFTRAGEVFIDGVRPHEKPKTLEKLCYAREKGLFPPGIRVRDALLACAFAYPHWDAEYAERLLPRFELNPKKKFKQLSRGMESALGLVIGLASRAELTIFDEPSLGLDAAARAYFYDELERELKARPRTVVISTHMIDEVSRLFDEVVIIDRGRVLTTAVTSELTGKYRELTGSNDAVDAALGTVKPLHREALDENTARAVAEWSGEAPEGVAVNPVSLQRLFVYLTEGGDASCAR